MAKPVKKFIFDFAAKNLAINLSKSISNLEYFVLETSIEPIKLGLTSILAQIEVAIKSSKAEIQAQSFEKENPELKNGHSQTNGVQKPKKEEENKKPDESANANFSSDEDVQVCYIIFTFSSKLLKLKLTKYQKMVQNR